MTDLFDHLVARALGIGPVARPAPALRFAAGSDARLEVAPDQSPGHEAELVDRRDVDRTDDVAPANATAARASGPERLPSRTEPTLPRPRPDSASVDRPGRSTNAVTPMPPITPPTGPQPRHTTTTSRATPEPAPASGLDPSRRRPESEVPLAAGPPHPAEAQPSRSTEPAKPGESATASLVEPLRGIEIQPLNLPAAFSSDRVSPERSLPDQTGIARPAAVDRAAEPDTESRSAAPTPSVQVTVSIGRVEVRAPARTDQPRPPASTRAHRPEPRISLQEYLRRSDRR